MTERRLKWSRRGDRMFVSVRDSTGYVTVITLPASGWPPEGDSGEMLDLEPSEPDRGTAAESEAPPMTEEQAREVLREYPDADLSAFKVQGDVEAMAREEAGVSMERVGKLLRKSFALDAELHDALKEPKKIICKCGYDPCRPQEHAGWTPE